MSSFLSNVGTVLTNALTPSIIAEQQREATTGDDKFLKPYLYFFELRIPASASANTFGLTSFYFPLVLNPESITLSEPFSVEVSTTQGAGVFVEENGIITRNLVVRGQTGWYPKLMQGNVRQLDSITQNKSFSRSLPADALFQTLSGLRHFQYLQDAVFRVYADLKRDPATSEGTVLLWHDPKHEEHWRVVPRNFQLDQNKDRPVSYFYTIDMLIVDKAESASFVLSEDKSLLDDIKDAVNTVQNFIAIAQGALQNITALEAAIKGVVQDIGTIINNVGQFINAASNFVNGFTSLIQTPIALVKATQQIIDNSLDFYNNLQTAGNAVVTLPASVVQACRQLSDSLDTLQMHPENFATSPEAFLATVLPQPQTAAAQKTLAIVAAAPAPTTFQALANLGTGPLPGDASQSKAITPPALPKAFTGATKYTVSQGDTLVNLAARFLGDARLWVYIAAANGLKPPFVNSLANAPLVPGIEQSLSGALGLGATLIIPNYSKPPESQPSLPVLGVPLDAPADIHLLGSDLLTAPAAPGSRQIDLVIDRDLGSSDFRTVTGVPNLAQALTCRLTTDRGTDTLYQGVGIQPLVGLNVSAVDIETARFRCQEAATADTRIAAVAGITFTAALDSVAIGLNVQIRGFTQPNYIQVDA